MSEVSDVGEDEFTRVTKDDVTSIDKRWTVPETFKSSTPFTRLLYLVLREEQPVTAEAISKRLSCNIRETRRRLQTMRKAGIVDRRYLVTEPSQKFYVLCEEYQPGEVGEGDDLPGETAEWDSL